MDIEYDIKQEVNDPEVLNELNQLDEEINVQNFLGIKIETESSESPMLHYSCDVCGFQAQTLQDITCHKKSEHAIDTYLCELCEYVGKYPLALKNHKVKHHGYTVINFPCNRCKYKARSEAKLNEHMAKHEAEQISFRETDKIKEEPNILYSIKTETSKAGMNPKISCTLCSFKTFKQIKFIICESCDFTTKFKL